MKRSVMFGTIVLVLILASLSMAKQPKPEEAIFHQTLPGLDDIHGYDFAKSSGDTIYLLGGRPQTAVWNNRWIYFDGHGQPLSAPFSRWISGKFELLGDMSWPHWTLWDRSHMWTGMLPSSVEVTARPGFDRTYSTANHFSITDDDGTTGVVPSWDPHGGWNPFGVDLLVDGTRCLWWGRYAPATWGNPAGSNFMEPGYGNSWNEVLRCTQAVDPSQSVEVTWTFDIQHEIEENNDWIYAQYWDAQDNQWVNVQTYTGTQYPHINEDHTFTLTPVQHDGNVILRYWFFSDGSYSDQDGYFPTLRGGAQLDNIGVFFDWGTGQAWHFEDFDSYPPGPPGHRTSFGPWELPFSYGVGNYAQLWQNPGHLAVCQYNYSWQAIFVNSGQYEPDVPARGGQSFTYGPGGYIVEPFSGLTGELEGNTTPLFTGIVSPVFALYDESGMCDVDNIWLQFDCYRHHEYPRPEAPWIFYSFSMRSTPGAPSTIDDYPWSTSSFYYGGPDYVRSTFNISTWREPGAQYAQIGLWASQYQQMGYDGTPAPYFDNVTVIGFPTIGPSVGADFVYMAQDNFPKAIPGTKQFDPMDPNWRIKWDRAWDIMPRDYPNNIPGDSLTVNVTPVRAGYEHHPYKTPVAHYAVKANPLFADVFDPIPGQRDYLNIPDLVPGSLIRDWSTNIYTFSVYLNPHAGQPYNWWLDIDGPDYYNPLPVFFPGDIIHYYIQAWDYNPITADEGMTTWPNNLTWFGNFAGYNDGTGETGRWPNEFTVYGLPSLYDDWGYITHPEILWVNAFWTRGGENEWYYAFKNAGFQPWGTVDDLPIDQYFDQYHVNRPDNNGGNHIGGRASVAALAHYKTIVFSFGNLSNHVMGSGEFIGQSYPNKADCLGLITNWLDLGGKCLFLTGDDLAFSNTLSMAGQTFNQNVLGVDFVARDVRPAIGNQYTPCVRPLPGNGVIQDDRCWVVYGGCPSKFSIGTFDHVLFHPWPNDLIAGFGGPDQDCYSWNNPYPTIAAAVRNLVPSSGFTSQVVYMPYDLMRIHNVPEYSSGRLPHVSERAKILGDIMGYFGQFGQNYTYFTPNAVLSVESYPNPFNPVTTIKLTLPRDGVVSIKVYNVRGELVRTLVNDKLEHGVHDIPWDGKNDRGAQAASGIYFYEVKTGGEVRIGKMALIK